MISFNKNKHLVFIKYNIHSTSKCIDRYWLLTFYPLLSIAVITFVMNFNLPIDS